MTEKKRVLVTGAGGDGFIGSHMADFLVAQGYDVVATDIAKGKFWNSRTDFVQANITHPLSLEPIFAAHTADPHHPYDYVFHVAAKFSYAASLDDLLSVNVAGTRNILRNILKHSPHAVSLSCA